MEAAVIVYERLEDLVRSRELSRLDMLAGMCIWRSAGAAVLEFIASEFAEIDAELAGNPHAHPLVSKCNPRESYERVRREEMTNDLEQYYVPIREEHDQKWKTWREEQRARALSNARDEQRRKVLQNIGDLWNELAGLVVPTGIPISSLGKADVKLVRMWMGESPGRDIASVTDGFAALSPKERDMHRRLLSARSGELAAIEFYSSLGLSTRDTSIEQVDLQSDGSWRLFDILAGDRAIDVKTSRRSLSSPDSYTEHVVPRFKSDRTGLPVHIAGILAPYISDCSDIVRGGNKWHDSAVFLGETTHNEILTLERVFSRLGPVRLEFRNDQTTTNYFIPAWLFDLPDAAYNTSPSFNQERGSLAKDLFAALAQVGAEKPCPALDLLGDLEGASIPPTLPGQYQASFDRLRKLGGSIGLSRPVLFLWLLTETLLAARDPERADRFRPAGLLPIVIVDFLGNTIDQGAKCRSPLGISDPLMTIMSLTMALEGLWSSNRRVLREFSAFRLRNHSILQGLGPEGRWQTLLAYCGGWKMRYDERGLYTQGKCGKSPLYLGDGIGEASFSCPECQRLVCPACGFCGGSCSECNPRQLRFANDPQATRA